MKRFDNLLHCDIRLFLHKFQNIVVLFFCKNCFPASQLRSGLITASACTLFYKAVYGAFIYWKIFCNFPGIMSFIPGLQYQFSSFICKGTALFKRFVIIAFHPFFIKIAARAIHSARSITFKPDSYSHTQYLFPDSQDFRWMPTLRHHSPEERHRKAASEVSGIFSFSDPYPCSKPYRGPQYLFCPS